MWDQIAEIINPEGIPAIISSKSWWTDLEVLAYARLIWGWNVKLIKRIDIEN